MKCTLLYSSFLSVMPAISIIVHHLLSSCCVVFDDDQRCAIVPGTRKENIKRVLHWGEVGEPALARLVATAGIV